MISNSFNAGGIRLSGTLNESNDYFEPRGDIIGEENLSDLFGPALEPGSLPTTRKNLQLMLDWDMFL